MTRKKEHLLSGIIRVAGICGLLVPVVIFTCLGLSLLSSPWFTWTDHALSDLGVQTTTAALFNYGMIAGGVLAFVFSLGLITVLSRKLGGYILLFSSLSLIGIGLFPETLFPLHFFTSAAFFVTLTIALLILGFTMQKDHFNRPVSFLALTCAVVAMVSAFFLFPLKGIALPEAFSCFPAFFWCFVVGAQMTFSQT
jgi:hypothetical membrane protein